jgi:Ni,Fe-hydrogenase maturation factor
VAERHPPASGRSSGSSGAATGGDLVIGLGNPLRGDDGVGWWLAQRAETHPSTPRVLRRSLLTPELSLELVTARRVLFLDAWLAPGRPSPGRAQPAGRGRRPALRPAPGPAAILCRLPAADPAEVEGQLLFSHGLRPSQLLLITTGLYGRTPPAWWLLVPAVAWEHGSGFSRQLRRRLPAAARLLRRWLDGAAGGGSVNPQPAVIPRPGIGASPAAAGRGVLRTADQGS